MIQPGKPTVIIDGQWGSTGKGKLAGYIASRYDPDIVIGDNMPNAGHTFVDDDGESVMFKQLPIGARFAPICLIGPHAVLNVDRFLEEAAMVEDWCKVIVHPAAAVMVKDDKSQEEALVEGVGSTGQGCYPALVRKGWRTGPPYGVAAEEPRLQDFVADTFGFLHGKLFRKARVLIEGSQGFDLSLNQGWKFPYVTSRDCTVGRMLDNAGLPVRSCGHIVASIRTYPIRVGGPSGPCYPDQEEMSWEEISEFVGVPVEERTTVTNRIRRVFSFSWQQLQRFLTMCGPDYLFLNFTNYLPKGARAGFLEELKSTIEAYDCKLWLEGTGPRDGEMICHIP